MQIKKTYIILFGLIVLALLALAAWREHSNSEQLQLEHGRAIEATEEAKLQKTAAIVAAEDAKTAREEAQQQHLVNAAERAELGAERDQYRRLYEAAAHRMEASEQQHQVQVAAIPTLQDADLAIATVRALDGVYPGHSLMIVPEAGDSGAFRANRPTIEITMQAGLEVGHLRDVELAQTDQLASRAGEIESWKEEVRIWSDDLTIEMVAREKAEASAVKWKDSSDGFERAAARWQEVDAARVRKQRWATIKDLLITGGITGAGIWIGGEVGYGIAGGAVGTYVVRRVF